MNLKQIQELIKFVAKSEVSEVELEKEDFKITIKTPKGSKDNSKEQPQAYAQLIPPQMPPGQAPPQNIQQQPQAQSAPPSQGDQSPSSSEAAHSEKKKAEEAPFNEIRSPMIGTFYRASEPGKDPFVKVGDKVEKGQVLCIVEAMKLFNEIESEYSGRIAKVLVEDATPVEYDQPLFYIEPA